MTDFLASPITAIDATLALIGFIALYIGYDAP